MIPPAYVPKEIKVSWTDPSTAKDKIAIRIEFKYSSDSESIKNLDLESDYDLHISVGKNSRRVYRIYFCVSLREFKEITNKLTKKKNLSESFIGEISNKIKDYIDDFEVLNKLREMYSFS